MSKLPTRPKTHNLPATAENKTILTDELIETVLAGMKRGNFVLQACQLAGIGKTAYYDWLKKAEEEPNSYPQCVKLANAIKKTTLDLEDSLVKTMHEIAIQDRNPKVIGWILERRWPKRWTRRTRFDIQAPAPTDPNPEGTYQTNIMIVLPDNGMRVQGPLALSHDSKSNKSDVKKPKK